jgi:nitroimidazol reductase NimA-like FMN-containing flavoprotein (pyridoxamine 5'-phosphate oxidase superfamily)
MLEILEMRADEIGEFLRQIGYGHLACCDGGRPYVVPIYYAYDGTDIYIYTTAGMKSEIISHNPNVCLQVEEIREDGGWRSVVVNGEAQEIVDRAERERAVELIRERNPHLLPALAIKWANDWMKKNVEVVYKIVIGSTNGKFTSEVKIAATSARPNFGSSSIL